MSKFVSYKESTYWGDLHAHEVKAIARKETLDNKVTKQQQLL